MAKNNIFRSQTFFVLLVLVSSALSEARPLRIIQIPTRNSVSESSEEIFEWLGALGGIKQSGPSPGEGHKFTNEETLGGIKDSGPSPGVGKKFTNKDGLGGVKNSGPSPGAGHKFTNRETLGGIKDGPSSPGEGHNIKNQKTLGGIKAGPSPGVGHK